MIRFILSLILFFLFVLEGSFFQVFAPELFGMEIDLVPRFIVVIIVIIGIYYGRPTAILYGICFGLLYDAVYTEILGVYMFTFGLVGYIFSLEYRAIQNSYFYNLLICLLAVVCVEYFTYGFLYLFEVTTMSHVQFFSERLLSTVGLNLIFTLIVLYPMQKLIRFYKKKEDPMAV